MADSGFALDVTEVDQSALDAVKRQSGISDQHASCHTAQIGNYTVEGHVPASTVKRLLAEKPDAVGLAVPGMPAGLRLAWKPTRPADSLRRRCSIKKDGTSEVFEHVPAAGQ